MDLFRSCRILFLLISITAIFTAFAGCSSSVSLPTAAVISLSRYDSSSKTVTISWDVNTDQNFTSYSIYRSDSADVDDGDTLVTSISDQAVASYSEVFDTKPDEYYYYAVYTDNSGGKSKSNVEMIRGLYLFKFSFGGPGDQDGEFNDVCDVAVDSSGNIYVADSNNYRIQKFDSEGNFISKWGVNGAGDGDFSDPSSIEYGPDGKLYVGDYGNSRIQMFDTSGTFLGKFDCGDTMGDPYIDADGKVFVPVFGDSVIKTYSPGYVYLDTIGSNGADNGQFKSIWDIAASPDGSKIYVMDVGNKRVQVFNEDLEFLSKFISDGTGPGDCDNCWGLAVDSNGLVYVTDYSEQKVQIYDGDGVFIEEFSIPSETYTNGIWGLCFDEGDNMYVTDAKHNVVNVFGP